MILGFESSLLESQTESTPHRDVIIVTFPGLGPGPGRGTGRGSILAERRQGFENNRAGQVVYAYCVASMLIFHLTINIGMVIGIVPVIGIPLPFFSYGGSSLWGFTILLFILLRIDAVRTEYGTW